MRGAGAARSGVTGAAATGAGGRTAAGSGRVSLDLGGANVWGRASGSRLKRRAANGPVKRETGAVGGGNESTGRGMLPLDNSWLATVDGGPSSSSTLISTLTLGSRVKKPVWPKASVVGIEEATKTTSAAA